MFQQNTELALKERAEIITDILQTKEELGIYFQRLNEMEQNFKTDLEFQRSLKNKQKFIQSQSSLDSGKRENPKERRKRKQIEFIDNFDKTPKLRLNYSPKFEGFREDAPRNMENEIGSQTALKNLVRGASGYESAQTEELVLTTFGDFEKNQAQRTESSVEYIDVGGEKQTQELNYEVQEMSASPFPISPEINQPIIIDPSYQVQRFKPVSNDRREDLLTLREQKMMEYEALLNRDRPANHDDLFKKRKMKKKAVGAYARFIDLSPVEETFKQCTGGTLPEVHGYDISPMTNSTVVKNIPMNNTQNELSIQSQSDLNNDQSLIDFHLSESIPMSSVISLPQSKYEREWEMEKIRQREKLLEEEEEVMRQRERILKIEEETRRLEKMREQRKMMSEIDKQNKNEALEKMLIKVRKEQRQKYFKNNLQKEARNSLENSQNRNREAPTIDYKKRFQIISYVDTMNQSKQSSSSTIAQEPKKKSIEQQRCNFYQPALQDLTNTPRLIENGQDKKRVFRYFGANSKSSPINYQPSIDYNHNAEIPILELSKACSQQNQVINSEISNTQESRLLHSISSMKQSTRGSSKHIVHQKSQKTPFSKKPHVPLPKASLSTKNFNLCEMSETLMSTRIGTTRDKENITRDQSKPSRRSKSRRRSGSRSKYNRLSQGKKARVTKRELKKIVKKNQKKLPRNIVKSKEEKRRQERKSRLQKQREYSKVKINIKF
jgi:hypothetical protein